MLPVIRTAAYQIACNFLVARKAEPNVALALSRSWGDSSGIQVRGEQQCNNDVAVPIMYQQSPT